MIHFWKGASVTSAWLLLGWLLLDCLLFGLLLLGWLLLGWLLLGSLLRLSLRTIELVRLDLRVERIPFGRGARWSNGAAHPSNYSRSSTVERNDLDGRGERRVHRLSSGNAERNEFDGRAVHRCFTMPRDCRDRSLLPFYTFCQTVSAQSARPLTLVMFAARKAVRTLRAPNFQKRIRSQFNAHIFFAL